MLRLTKRQQEILELIQNHLDSTGSPPTRAEIAKLMGFKSPNAAEDHLRALAKKGVIELVPGTSRGIRLTSQMSNSIPLIEDIKIGHPILSDDHIKKQCRVEHSLFEHPADYLLHWTTSNLPDLGIQKGDYIAIHQTQEPNFNNLILLYEEELIITRFTEKLEYNPAIEGLVLGVIRSFSNKVYER